MNQSSIKPVESPPKKIISGSQFVILFVSIFAICAYLGSAYYFTVWPFEVFAIPIPTFTQRPSSDVKIQDTSNWKTYVNDIYGFNFKYPPTLKLKLENPNLNPGLISFLSIDQPPQGSYIGINVISNNNPARLTLSEWWNKNHGEEQCFSAPKEIKINSLTAMQVYSSPQCPDFIKSNINEIIVADNDRIITFDGHDISETQQVASTIQFTNSTNNLVNDNPISYALNNKLFTLSKKYSTVLKEFNAKDLAANSAECSVNNSESYYKNLLSRYSVNDQVVRYYFHFIAATQAGGDYIITIIPNRIGYKNDADFAADFSICAVGGPLYPDATSNNYLLFKPACGTGGCEEVQNFIEPTIKLLN